MRVHERAHKHERAHVHNAPPTFVLLPSVSPSRFIVYQQLPSYFNNSWHLNDCLYYYIVSLPVAAALAPFVMAQMESSFILD